MSFLTGALSDQHLRSEDGLLIRIAPVILISKIFWFILDVMSTISLPAIKKLLMDATKPPSGPPHQWTSGQSSAARPGQYFNISVICYLIKTIRDIVIKPSQYFRVWYSWKFHDDNKITGNIIILSGASRQRLPGRPFSLPFLPSVIRMALQVHPL